MNPYICHVIFFIVLDLRLTKVGVQRYSFFYAHTLTVVIWKLYKSLIGVFLIGKNSKTKQIDYFISVHFCYKLTLLISILQRKSVQKIKLYKIAFRYQAIQLQATNKSKNNPAIRLFWKLLIILQPVT